MTNDKRSDGSLAELLCALSFATGLVHNQETFAEMVR